MNLDADAEVDGHAGTILANGTAAAHIVDGDELASGVSFPFVLRRTLSTQRLPAPPPPRQRFETESRKEWAHVVNVNQELVNVG